MITVSLCMIVKDEEKTLERCLNAAKSVVDEIIIVDTGSVDRTKEIAAKYTDKIFDFPWSNDFSAARNASFDRATMDYILWLDADDIILPADAVKLKKLKQTLTPDVDVVFMRYNTGFDEQGRVIFSYNRERLLKRDRHFSWQEPVHEFLSVGGHSLYSDICITHSRQKMVVSDRNIKIYEKIISEGKTLSPRGMYYYARELKDNGRYQEAINIFRQFLMLGAGWQEDNIAACAELAKCYALTGNHKKALISALQSFVYDTPRAENCCQIGFIFKECGDYRQAVFWFETALSLKKPDTPRGFYQEECWGYIPSIECAVCYDRLKDYKKAEYYNNLAAEYKPESAMVLFNKRYFAEREKI